MLALGTALLIAALVTTIGGAAAALRGAAVGDARLLSVSRRAVAAYLVLMIATVALLESAFIRNDFSFALVVDGSEKVQPLFYRITAMWGSQAGSLLLWAFVLSIVTAASVGLNWRRHREITPIASAILLGLGAFFVGLMLFGASPFEATPGPVPMDGNGLQPLLRHPSMMIHPTMLYSGYVWFAVPFAFAIAALWTRRVDAAWISATRKFTLVAWTFLTLGVLLGARWSYTELGWGGYWGWDPVENAALMPWLIGTAFLHSVIVQERRGMLKVWNVSLITGTFALALIGTLIVRSNILESIHAFGASTVGPPILVLVGIVIFGSTALIVSRLNLLQSERRIDAILSRESIFLINNLLLVALAFVIFWGTFFPVISELITGNREKLGAGFFGRAALPLSLLLVLFTGIGPIFAWRQVSWRSVRGRFVIPMLAAIGAALIGIALAGTPSGAGQIAGIGMFAICGFTLAALAEELVRNAAALRSLSGRGWAQSFGGAITRNRRRWGGYTVHAGLAVLFIGIAASSAFQTNRDLRLAPGQSASVGGYEFRYSQPTVDRNAQRIAFGATLAVTRNGAPVTTLRPSRNYYVSKNPQGGVFGSFFEGEATSEVGLRAGLSKDLWTAMRPDIEKVTQRADTADRRLAALQRRRPAQFNQLIQTPAALQQILNQIAGSYAGAATPVTFRVIVNPMVSWMWIGVLIAIGGALLALWPGGLAGGSRVSSVEAARRLARDLGAQRGQPAS